MRYLIAAYVAALVLLTGAALAGAVAVIEAMGPSGPAENAASRDRFSVPFWELRHFPEKWLYKLGDLFADQKEGKGDDDGDILERYFNLTARMRAMSSEESGSYLALEEERAWLENTVEDIIEGRLTSILEDEGLTLDPPLFNDLGIVYPPVDFEFDAPPRVLVTSPRDRIALQDDILLKPGLGAARAQEIEAEVESGGELSALVVPTGGVATYPSVVSNLRDYDSLIELVAHEWTHQYLAFYPLGFSYYDSGDLRTLNESVASIAGRELAALYFEKFGRLTLHSGGGASPQPTPAPADDGFDFTSEMRALRLEVEDLLAAGRIEEAEALMSGKRDYFEERGVYIRKLNQAYFAFYGFYGDSPASVDPIGPKLETVYAAAGSPGAFLHRVRGITTRAELDRLLDG